MKNKDIKDLIRQIKESKSYKEYEDSEEPELKEVNVTGNVAGYDTPNAFASSEKDHEDKIKSGLDSYGYSVAKKGDKRNTVKSESLYRAAMSSLHEVSYRDFKSDQTRPTGRKINDSIKSIDNALREIERAVKHASKLKNEANVDQRSLWKSSHSRLVRIHDRLVRIGKTINELGA